MANTALDVLNQTQTELLQKYDDAINRFIEIDSYFEDGKAIEAINAENSLKLGGKTLEEVLAAGGTGNIRQIKQIINNSQYSTTSADYVKAFDFSFDNEIDPNSTILIQVQGSMYRDPYDRFASYITIFRDDNVNCGKQRNTTVNGNTEYSAFRLGGGYQSSFSFTVIDKPNETNPKYSIMFADLGGSTTLLGFIDNNNHAHGMQIIMMEIGV